MKTKIAAKKPTAYILMWNDGEEGSSATPIHAFIVQPSITVLKKMNIGWGPSWAKDVQRLLDIGELYWEEVTLEI